MPLKVFSDNRTHQQKKKKKKSRIEQIENEREGMCVPP
jgi:hypothetical protein